MYALRSPGKPFLFRVAEMSENPTSTNTGIRPESKQHRAMTTQAIRALAERERTKAHAKEQRSAGPSRLWMALGVVAAAAVLYWGYTVFGGGGRDALVRGADSGAASAAEHVKKDHCVLHTVGTSDATGIADRGKAWQKLLREKYKVMVATHSDVDATIDGRTDYYRAYNEVVLEHLRAKHGADFLERAASESR